MNYRMLALSVDGSILKENGRMSRTTKEAIEFVQDKGVYVTLCSNRSHQQLEKIAKHLKINHELISYGGGLIAGKADKPLHAARFPVEMARDVAMELEHFSCQIVVEHEKFELTNRQQQPQNFLGKMTVSLSESLFSQSVVDHLSEHIDLHRIEPIRFRVHFETEELKAIAVKHLHERIPDVRILDLRLDQTIYISTKQATKAESLLFLGHELGIRPEEIVATGCKVGDEQLLNSVGIGVAMGGSPPSVVSASNWLTRSVDQNGLAYMIKEVFRKQMKVSLL
ncbi:HAD hydrolase family protein [Geomicrobium sediminis]|uniref:Hydroxymethylpyrimidine pyrophosphatase-like HAD family hydrolase n=2 Tax=Geomicrobium TaxID=767528 RepID=A0ABS2PEW5_9BACL|nr:HAD hydrolase family protein [Geomicrobium sediminis]MBM7633967.1 hydroxymethylpyrimidine pyrophosphatase-like HAD family hydrolase [Geomicrobium sediminis]